MAQLYTLVYTRTNLENTTMAGKGGAVTKNLGLSNFAISGNGKGKRIGKVVSVKFKHSHTATKTPSISIRSNLVSAKGTVSSPYQTWSFSGDTVTKTDTFTDVPAEVLNNLTNIQIQCKAFSSTSDLYYRAITTYPMVLTITFYEAGTLRYFHEGKWVECRTYHFQNGTWIPVRAYCFHNGEWVQSE